jgi:Uncharacterized protein conserved in bacteria
MKGWNFLKNIYVKNILLAIIIIALLVFVILLSLNIYTRHGQTVVIPDVQGLRPDEAATFFSSKKLRYEIIDSVYNEHATAGSIVRTIPAAGSKVKENRIVFITVNMQGAPPLIIPDLIDQSQRQASVKLTSIGFTNVKIEYVPGAYKDLVVGLKSNGRELTPGEKIPMNERLVLQISSGYGSSSEDTSNLEFEEETGLSDESEF